MDMPIRKKKIAILGGGVSAMTTAFALTSEPDWQNRYDITLYQMGWRLGGKGASGRNRDEHERIEEHGIHVWFGFYYNAFRLLRACYTELGRQPGQPLATVDEAFHAHDTTAFAHHFDGAWTIWPIETFALPGRPGEGWDPKPLMEHVAALIDWLLAHLGSHERAKAHGLPLLHRLEQDLTARLDGVRLKLLREGLEKAVDQCRSLASSTRMGIAAAASHRILIGLLLELRKLARALTAPFADSHVGAARLWMTLDFGLTTVIGFLQDELYEKGLDAINGVNFKDWLASHGASAMTLDGPILAALYGGIFAYRDGDTAQPDVEAGTVLKGGLLAVSCAKGSFIWRMEAGMGDVVFAPYYEVLKRRGVRFEFFHKVQELRAATTETGPRVTEIRIARQVPLKDPAKGYEPLVDVNGLPCWPSAPLYEQIDDEVARKLQEHHINLESSWSNWPEIYPQEELTLLAGRDFDLVVLGISVAGLPALCPTLLAANPRFKEMTERVSTVATQAYQLWMNQDIRALGWPRYRPNEEAPEILGFNAQALDSWADVSYLVGRETWPADRAPKDISYFCGVFHPDPAPAPPDPAYPLSQARRVKGDVVKMLQNTVGALWPNANPPGSGSFRWDFLVAPDGSQGIERLDAQYWRANVDPSERYVQSCTGTSIYRLPTDGSGFDNLYLTGDWILNGFNMGCVESATWSGLQCAKAISGSVDAIPGVPDFMEPQTSYEQLLEETEALCRRIENSPEERRAVRVAFYKRFGEQAMRAAALRGGMRRHEALDPETGFLVVDGLNFGNSELAFLDWAIRRGALNPVEGPNPGSPWWRDVNLNYIFLSELAGKLQEHGVPADRAPMPVRQWLAYLASPSPESWYRAHNASILDGFRRCLDTARERENEVERRFLNIVQYRLMFAQALVNDATIFGALGELIADPRGFAVKLIVSLPDFYPTHYPLTPADEKVIDGDGRGIEGLAVRVLDDVIILPSLARLYDAAAGWNDSPFLRDYQHRGVPDYALGAEPCGDIDVKEADVKGAADMA